MTDAAEPQSGPSEDTSTGSERPRLTDHLEEQSSWVQAVADAAGRTDTVRVSDILDRYNVPAGQLPPPRAPLRVTGIHFAGVKNLPGPDGSGGRNLQPFSFTHQLGGQVDAFATLNKNEAGKSSILHVILWALRGRTALQRDVRMWLHHAAVGLRIGDQDFVVLWQVEQGRPRGQVLRLAGEAAVDWEELHTSATEATAVAAAAGRNGTSVTDPEDHEADDSNAGSTGGSESGAVDETHGAGISSEQDRAAWPESPVRLLARALIGDGAVEVDAFSGEDAFEEVIDRLMLARLGFQALPTWQKARDALGDDDGSITTHRWTTWSQALAITDPSIKATLGETPLLATRLLQVYLGTIWAATATVADARLKEVRSQVAGIRRRAQADVSARKRNVEQLKAEVAAVAAQIDHLPEGDTSAEVDAAMTGLTEAASEASDTQRTLLEAASDLGTALKALEQVDGDVAALWEAQETRRFWHSLKPSCCPRCDTEVDQARWAREPDGRCSLCDSEVQLTVTAPPAAVLDAVFGDEEDTLADLDLDATGAGGPNGNGYDEESLDELVAARLQRQQLRERVAQLDEEHTLAERASRRCAGRLATAQQVVAQIDPDALRRRRDLETQLALLQGRLAEREEATRESQAAPKDLEYDEAVLRAASDVATIRRDDEQRQLLEQVNEQVTKLGRDLGVAQLESAQLMANSWMPVVKGGARHNFGALTDGERLRLKIALVIALLRVGTKAGVTRHPGLLIIDSLTREELDPQDAQAMLSELVGLAAQVDLQVITTSAHGDVLAQVLTGGALRLAPEGAPMW